MHALISFVSVIHVILCVLIVLAVLVQQGKGAEISASFGGSSQTVFGSSGGANFFSTFTGTCAALFMVTSVFLAVQGGSRMMSKSLMDTGIPAPATAPATAPTAAAPAATAPEAAAKPAAQAESAVVPPKPETQAHAPDQTTKNAISPGQANLPSRSAPNPTAPQKK
jgi:preprotein translocase subunit SecG